MATKKAAKKKTAAKKKAPAAKKKAAAKTKKAVAKKPAAKKKAAAPKKKVAAKKTTAKKAVKKTAAKKKTAKKKSAPVKKIVTAIKKRPVIAPQKVAKPVLSKRTTKTGKIKKLPAAFLRKQKQKLLDLHDSMVDQMNGISRDALAGTGDSDSSAFGMHQADAGSDAYDREFALNLLSQEQDAIHEIEDALRRIDEGTYGVCEGSGEPIPQARLEAMPFARCTVAYQEQLDRGDGPAIGNRGPVGTLFEPNDKDSK